MARKNRDSGRELRLAKRVAGGDERAVELLYARYANPLFAFIYHRLDGARADAEDIWQETLLTVLQALPTYGGQSQLLTWMCGIARHKIADHYRHRGQPVASPSGISPDQVAELMNEAPLPEQLLTQSATRAFVVEALATLPEQYRIALIARYADEQSVADVARLLHKTYKATESLLARARSAFRLALTQVEEKQDGE